MKITAMRFDQVTRRFGDAEALARFTAEVPEGSITALLGRNGAGKTTAIRCALGLLGIQSGKIEVLGADATVSGGLSESVRARIGYVSERVSLDPRSTLAELCDLSRAMYSTWDDAYAAELATRLQLPVDRPLGDVSLGQSRKAALLLNLAFRPRLLILDEPAGNLDAVVRREFLEAVLETFSAEGTTILLSTHLLHDVERLADRVILIENGRCRLELPLEELHARVKAIRVTARNGMAERLAALPNVLSTKRFGDDLILVVEGYHEGAESEFATITGGRVDVVDLSLEDIFIAYGSNAAWDDAGPAREHGRFA